MLPTTYIQRSDLQNQCSTIILCTTCVTYLIQIHGWLNYISLENRCCRLPSYPEKTEKFYFDKQHIVYLLAVCVFSPENTSVWSSVLNWITRDTAERHISYVFFAVYCVSLVPSSINKSFAAKLNSFKPKVVFHISLHFSKYCPYRRINETKFIDL